MNQVPWEISKIIQANGGVGVVLKHERLLQEIINYLWWCWPWWFYLYHPFPRFQIWHVHTSGTYVWLWKTDYRNWRTYAGGESVSHGNRHTYLLTFVARSLHHCHLALAIIDNVTTDSSVNWIASLAPTHPVLLVKALRLVFSRKMVVEWQIYFQHFQLHFQLLRGT